jgi:hypothetical protein
MRQFLTMAGMPEFLIRVRNGLVAATLYPAREKAPGFWAGGFR